MDLYPYSGRLGGSMSDADHELLWAGWQDGVYPGQASSACLVGVNAGQWLVYPGRILIAGHVLDLDVTQYGALPANAAATRTSVVVAYIDHSKNPWQYGVQLVIGSPGGGRPALSKSRTGLYQVPLRAMTNTPAGTVTLLDDERIILQPAGSSLLRASTVTPANVPATITGADGQSTSLLRIQRDPGGPYVFAVAQNGHIGVGATGGASTNIALWAKADSAADITCRLVAATGQTGRVFQIVDDTGKETVGISQAGSLTILGNLDAKNFDVTDWATYDPSPAGGGSATYTTRKGWWKRVGVKDVRYRVQFVIGVAGTGNTTWNWHLPTSASRDGRQAVGHGHTEAPGSILEAITTDGGSGTTVNATLQVTSAATGNMTGADLKAGMIVTLQGEYQEA